MTTADAAPEPAAAWPPPGARPRIGEMLVEEGLVSPAELATALEVQRRTGLRLGQTVVTLGFASSFDVARVLARRLEVDFVDLGAVTVDPEVALLVPEEVARRYRALPVWRADAGIVVVMCDPRDVFAIDDLRSLLREPVLPALGDPGQVDLAVARAFAGTSEPEPASPTAADDAARALHALAHPARTDAPDELVHEVLADAIDAGASAVHFEPVADGIAVRYRIAGALRAVDAPPLAAHAAAMQVVKILAGVDPAAADRPQRGRFSVTHAGRTVGVTLATLPTARGEVAVLGITPVDAPPRALDDLGMTPGQLATCRAALDARHGLVLVAGPPGSGVATTLAAATAAVDHPERGVVALDRALRSVPSTSRVREVVLDPARGVGPTEAVTAAVRADADVVVVGELDSPGIARAAVDAARGNRLVLATLDAPRAAAAPARLVALGVPAYALASALTCVVATRLAAATGGDGRVALHEVLGSGETTARLVAEGADADEIERWAVADGFDTFRMVGNRQVDHGVLTPDEVVRVIP